MWYSPYLILPLASWFISHLIKFAINLYKGDFSLSYFYRSGGMPSAHSAAVSALAMTILAIDGITSPLFGIAALMAAIVIYDSMGVRRTVGEHATTLGSLLGNTGLSIKQLRPALGHKPLEVVAGVMIGSVTALVSTTPNWIPKIGPLLTKPTDAEANIYLFTFIGLTAVATTVHLKLRTRKFRKLPASRRLRNMFWASFGAFGLLGLFFVLVEQQDIFKWEWRIWPILTLVTFGLVQIFLARGLYKQNFSKLKAEIIEKQTKKATKNKHKPKKRRK
jgi:acid phosphatase family membrane protein YuiD